MTPPAGAAPTRPILYSFRRCPYAIRARLALHASRTAYVLREVRLRDKPAALLAASPKGSVPVLVLPDGRVIDESWDIMRWALQRYDPARWLTAGHASCVDDAARLIEANDGAFKRALDQYKYADPAAPADRLRHRAQGEVFLRALEDRLAERAYLLGDAVTIADAALWPFVRQFAAVDPAWFDAAAFPGLRAWLRRGVESSLFAAVMRKYPVWHPDDAPCVPEL